MFSYVFLINLLIGLPGVFFLVSLCLSTNLRSRIAASTCTHADVMVVIDVFVVIYFTKRGGIGLAISLWSTSTGYSASMLIKGAKFDLSSFDSSTLSTLDQHQCRISSAT